ncbi:MAG: MATE family efflux transporter, partial [Ruminococcus bromii]|nr:MATE family efflux transporter [Ruminococcus bromii]
MTKEMTHGSPMKLILGFTIPLLFGNLFQQFYSMVDTIIVGRVLGTGPLAAVGSTGSVTFLIIGFCLGLCSGFAIPVAQRFGSRDYDELRRFIGNAVWLCVGFGALLTL